jgi:hypothetical protein
VGFQNQDCPSQGHEDSQSHDQDWSSQRHEDKQSTHGGEVGPGNCFSVPIFFLGSIAGREAEEEPQARFEGGFPAAHRPVQGACQPMRSFASSISPLMSSLSLSLLRSIAQMF